MNVDNKLVQFILLALIAYVAYKWYKNFFGYEGYDSISQSNDFFTLQGKYKPKCNDSKENFGFREAFNFRGNYCGAVRGAPEQIELVPLEAMPHIPRKPRIGGCGGNNKLLYSPPVNHTITNRHAHKTFPVYLH